MPASLRFETYLRPGAMPVIPRRFDCAQTMFTEAWEELLVSKGGACLSVNPANSQHVKAACHLLGDVCASLNLPLTAQDQTTAGKPWTASQFSWGRAAPGSWQRVTVPILAIEPDGLVCQFQGARQAMAWKWFRIYCDRLFAVVNPQSHRLEGFDLDRFQADLTSVAG